MNDIELQEYFAVEKAVSDFDLRLLTIKGWGVTLSLAALGFGFQYRSYGLFLVAAASSAAFWTLEGTVKRHQMRHYFRMLQIEVSRAGLPETSPGHVSAPRIHWSWMQADDYFRGTLAGYDAPPEFRKEKHKSYLLAWLLPHVALPHAITLALGTLLFFLGRFDHLTGFTLGAAGK